MNRLFIPFLAYFLWLAHLQTQAQDKKLVEVIKQYAHPLTTVEPLAPNGDLSFLKETLKDKSIIGLGEATHGTKEFFLMKHRLLKYLVEEMGYKVFAIEANFSECLAINDYVMYGKGDPEIALRGIYFWTWNTVEVLDMIKWMRAYNENKPDKEKVKFYGFDMQYTYGAANSVKTYMDKQKIDYTAFRTILDSLASNKSYTALADSARKEALLNQVKKLNEYSQVYQQLMQNTSEKAYQLHIQHINIMVQAITNALEGDGYRDSCMAANVQWLKNYEETDKIVLWAHNAHLCKTKMASTMTYFMMGYWLNKMFNEAYYAISFDFNTGNFRSKEALFISESTKMDYRMQEFTIDRTSKNTSNYPFSKTGIPLLFLDFSSASANAELDNFLSGNTKTKVIGAAYWPKKESSYYFTLKLKEVFDATIYIDKTTASVPIPGYTKYVEEMKAKK